MGEKIVEYEIDEHNGTKAQYVKIANPVQLGVHIAIGMFIIMFPLFIALIFIAISIGMIN